MLWALVNEERSKACPGMIGYCPGCGSEMMPKCGEIVTWHWSHRGASCDPWSEAEGEWHRVWKARFPDDWQEVNIGGRLADVKTPTAVIEFQASPISPEEIEAREGHYGQMVWMLKGDDFCWNLDIRPKGGYWSFRWKWPRKSWWYATKPLLIDLGGMGYPGELFLVKRMHHEVPCGGWGRWLSYDTFIGRALGA